MTSTHTYDLLIVGAGMMGLAHAYHAARAGLSVAVVERDAQANGASVRNFGMLALVAQQPGPELERAERAKAHWLEITKQAGISMRPAGCVFVAHTPEELQVMREASQMTDHSFALLDPADLTRQVPALRRDGLLGGLFSANAWKLDQRKAMSQMADWLALAHGVQFHFNTSVHAVEEGVAHCTTGSLHAAQILICTGDSLDALLPEATRNHALGTCQLQMQRTVPQPNGWSLIPFVLGGLSLPRYTAFQTCPSLPALIERQANEQAEALKNGVHVIVCQEDDGSLTIGDSHHYGDDAPDRRIPEVDDLILKIAVDMVDIPRPTITEHWMGRYAHMSGQDMLGLHLPSGVSAVTMTNGQGMTHGLAIAERFVQDAYK